MSKLLSTLLGLALLVGLAAAAWFGILWIFSLVQGGGGAANLTTGLLLAALGGLGYLYRAQSERKQDLEARLAESKRGLYVAYVDILKEVAALRGAQPKNADESIARLRDFAFRSVLLGSDEVIRAHTRFINIERIAPGGGGKAALPAIADVLVALRRDMGFRDTAISARDILGVFVNELDDLGPLFADWEIAKRDWDAQMGWKEGPWWRRQSSSTSRE